MINYKQLRHCKDMIIKRLIILVVKLCIEISQAALSHVFGIDNTL